MRRLNPWVAVPALLAGLAGGLIGHAFVRIGCRTCRVAPWVVAVMVGLASLVGVAIVAALVIRSLDEWRELQAQPPESGESNSDPSPPTC